MKKKIYKITLLVIGLVGVLIIINYKMNKSNIDKNEIRRMETKYINQPSNSIKTLKNKILFDGDKKSYRELYNFLVLDQMKPDEFLFWALIWANKYDQPEGYYDVYSCLVESCYSDTLKYSEGKFYPSCFIWVNDKKYPSLNHLDDSTRNLALQYLIIASEKGSENAKNELGQLREIIDFSEMGIGTNPDSDSVSK